MEFGLQMCIAEENLIKIDECKAAPDVTINYSAEIAQMPLCCTPSLDPDKDDPLSTDLHMAYRFWIWHSMVNQLHPQKQAIGIGFLGQNCERSYTFLSQ